MNSADMNPDNGHAVNGHANGTGKGQDVVIDVRLNSLYYR